MSTILVCQNMVQGVIDCVDNSLNITLANSINDVMIFWCGEQG